MHLKRTINIGAATYTVVSDDRYLARMGHDFEPDLLELLGTFMDRSTGVADVGANIGLTTLFFAQNARQVVAFEPSPSTFRFLEQNVAASGHENCLLINCGLGNCRQDSEITFSTQDRSGAYVSTLVRPVRDHVTERVLIDTLDSVWRQRPVPLDFLKIDVEGFEQEVIEGGLATIERYKPTVVLELNHWCLNAFRRRCVPDFFDFLRGVFPVLHAVDHDNRAIRDLRDNDEAYEVMHEHIVRSRFPNIVAGFDPAIRKTLLRLAGA